MAKTQYPEPTCAALIFNPKKEILLIKSHKWGGKYVIPGGHIEIGETALKTLKREIKEETNLNIYDINFIGWQESIFDKAFWKKKHFIFLDFSCKTKSKNVKLNWEGQEYVWVSINKALEVSVGSYTRKTIIAYMQQNKSNL